MTQFRDIMVDIETGGIDPSHCAMIQLSAVPFAMETRDVGFEMFDRCLAVPEGRYFEETCRREFWGNNVETLAGITGRMEPPAQVVDDFVSWCRALGNGQKLRFWSRPLSFDYPFVSSYLRMYGHDPFDTIPHFDGRDVHSFLAGCGVADPRKHVKDLPFEGMPHNALHDCLHAVKALFSVTF